MQKIKREKFTIIEISIVLLLLVYVGIFCYLNIAKLVEHADSDTASEVLLAREIWEEKDISPDNWISSTERRIISPATVGALFYGMGVPMNLAMGLACILCGGAVLASFVYLLRTAGVGRIGILTATLLLLCLPVNGIERADSMLPFFHYLLFLFADYYAPHVIVMLVALATYLRLRRGECTPMLVITGGGSVVLALALGASGMRCFQVVTAPLILLEIRHLYQETKEFTVKLHARRFGATAYIVLLVLCTLFGMAYPSSVRQPMFMLNGAQIAGRLFSEIPAAILKCLGIAGNCALLSFDGIMQLCIYLFAFTAVWGFWFVSKHREQVKEDIVSVMYFFIFALLVTILAVAITSVAAYHYYFFMVIFLVAVSVGYLADGLSHRYKVMWAVLSLIICFYGLANLVYTYLPAVSSDSRQNKLEEVSDYLENCGIEYGYAQFWNANRLTIVSEGRVTMGNVYDMSNLQMYWWLTNPTWYVPTLPENMTTAYVVTPEEEEGFLAGIGNHANVEKVFENEEFKVYISDKNLVGK